MKGNFSLPRGSSLVPGGCTKCLRYVRIPTREHRPSKVYNRRIQVNGSCDQDLAPDSCLRTALLLQPCATRRGWDAKCRTKGTRGPSERRERNKNPKNGPPCPDRIRLSCLRVSGLYQTELLEGFLALGRGCGTRHAHTTCLCPGRLARTPQCGQPEGLPRGTIRWSSEPSCAQNARTASLASGALFAALQTR